jgi:hypothetical protein
VSNSSVYTAEEVQNLLAQKLAQHQIDTSNMQCIDAPYDTDSALTEMIADDNNEIDRLLVSENDEISNTCIES